MGNAKSHITTVISKTVAMIAIMMLSSCIEIVSNGDFDGHWHLMSTEDLDTHVTTDMSQKYIFWGVAVHLINIRDIEQRELDKYKLGYYLRFSRSENTLVITEAFDNRWHQSEEEEESGDLPMTDITPLHHFGIFSLPQTFQIEHLSSSKMTLVSEKQRMTFKKQ